MDYILLVSTLNKLVIIIIIAIIIIIIITKIITKIIIIIMIIFEADVGGDYMIPVGRDEIQSLIPVKRDHSYVLPRPRFAGTKLSYVIVSAHLSRIKKLINISV